MRAAADCREHPCQKCCCRLTRVRMGGRETDKILRGGKLGAAFLVYNVLRHIGVGVDRHGLEGEVGGGVEEDVVALVRDLGNRDIKVGGRGVIPL